MSTNVVALRPTEPDNETNPTRDRVLTSLRRGRKPKGRAVYSVAEVAELLDLSLGSTYVALRIGEIPARQIGNRWVISKQRFHDWLDEAHEDGE